MKAFVLVSLWLAACGAESPSTQTPAAVAPAPTTLDLARKDLVFRYLDPASGEVATAASADAIPAAAKREVVVYDANVQLPAGWDLVADLTRGTTATPRLNFSFATRAAATPSTEAPTRVEAAGNHEVVMFSTEGCGYCAKARKFFSENRVPYTELDLEEDPAAPGRLSALGQKAGLGARDLQGVPIFFIDGHPLLGWDPNRLANLLGLRG